MYRLSIKETFSAAHFLDGYRGACASMHGHNWDVEVFIVSDRLNQMGMVVDFKDLKRITKKILSELDHELLNRVLPEGLNPTAENIAKYLFDKFKTAFAIQEKNNVLKVDKIRIFENRNSCCEYSG